jgi:hypothetical protein
MNRDQQPPLEVTTADGTTIDLAPLITAAHGIRRNALQGSEHDSETTISRQETAFVTMGMRIAVRHLLGPDAEKLFSEHLGGPAQDASGPPRTDAI